MIGPILLGRLNLKQRAHFRAQGKGFFAINRLMEGFNADTVAAAVAEAELETPGTQDAFTALAMKEPGAIASGSVGAFGDGSIIKALVAAWEKFASSDFGKAVIAALERLLLSFLVPVP